MAQTIQQAELDFSDNNLPKSLRFSDIYYSLDDGIAESNYVFIEGNHLWERWLSWQEHHFIIAESGFGSGLNFLLSCQLFQKFRQLYPESPLKRLFFISFEKYPFSVDQFAQAHQHFPTLQTLSVQLQNRWPIALIPGCQRLHFNDVILDIWFGDIHDSLAQFDQSMNNKVNAWFLDGFAPSKNNSMWQENLYKKMFAFSANHATFATFTAASAVRKGLINAGFSVNKLKGFGRKREMLQGSLSKSSLHSCSQPWLYRPSSVTIQNDNAECSTLDIAIIGGGVASLFIAESLLERGASVTLYCKDESVAMQASSNIQGAFYPQLSDDDLRNSRFYAHAFNYGYQKYSLFETDDEAVIKLDGVSLVGYNEKSQSKLDKILAQQWPDSLIQACDAEKLSQLSNITLPHGGAFIPYGGWLTPQNVVRKGFQQLIAKGLKVKLNCAIQSFKERNGLWHLNSDKRSYSHQLIVLANGYEITQFQQSAEIPVYPVRGQVSQVNSHGELHQLKSVLCFDGYLTPNHPNLQTHCLGASHVRNSTDRSFSLSEHNDNLVRIQRNLSNCDWVNSIKLNNDARCGVRCSSRERVPFAGAVANLNKLQKAYHNLFNLRRRREFIPLAPHHDNLFIVGALGSRGLTSAPLLGELIASQIYAEPLPLSSDILSNLNPNRSWIRKLLKGTPIR